MDEIFRRAREKWRPRLRDSERSAGDAPAHRLLRMDRLGLGSYTPRHFAFLYKQLSVRAAGRKYTYCRSASLQRAQSRFPPRWDSGRASRVRKIRLSRLAPPRGGSRTCRGSAGKRCAARDPEIYGLRCPSVLRPDADWRHYRADPGGFYGIDLARLLPSNLLRTWHLQLAILWIATAYVGGALFVAGMLGRSEPTGQRSAIHLLFAALFVVVVGSLLGEWAGLLQWLGNAWFWFGNQGWEYLEIGRFWQILLAAGLIFWFGLLWRAVAPAWRDPERRGLTTFFLIAAAAIPVFLPACSVFRWFDPLHGRGYLAFLDNPSLGRRLLRAVRHGHRRDHLLSAWAGRAYHRSAGYLSRRHLIFGGGLIGTGHHWYFTGQTQLNMALSATFSALEVVPLTLLTLDAADFVTVTRGDAGVPFRHKWTFYFLMAVGFWNFTGAGVFGFLINMPIVSYFEVGTNLTPNHGHAAMMGVFGMLGVALMVFVLRETVHESLWPRLEKYVRCGFWGLNIGLAMMILFSLFPSGVLQVRDVLENGYWHARSLAYLSGAMPRLLEWLRLPGDLVFIFLGALPILLAVGLGYLSLWSERPQAGAPRRAAAA